MFKFHFLIYLLTTFVVLQEPLFAGDPTEASQSLSKEDCTEEVKALLDPSVENNNIPVEDYRGPPSQLQYGLKMRYRTLRGLLDTRKLEPSPPFSEALKFAPIANAWQFLKSQGYHVAYVKADYLTKYPHKLRDFFLATSNRRMIFNFNYWLREPNIVFAQVSVARYVAHRLMESSDASDFAKTLSPDTLKHLDFILGKTTPDHSDESDAHGDSNVALAAMPEDKTPRKINAQKLEFISSLVGSVLGENTALNFYLSIRSRLPYFKSSYDENILHGVMSSLPGGKPNPYGLHHFFVRQLERNFGVDISFARDIVNSVADLHLAEKYRLPALELGNSGTYVANNIKVYPFENSLEPLQIFSLGVGHSKDYSQILWNKLGLSTQEDWWQSFSLNANGDSGLFVSSDSKISSDAPKVVSEMVWWKANKTDSAAEPFFLKSTSEYVWHAMLSPLDSDPKSHHALLGRKDGIIEEWNLSEKKIIRTLNVGPENLGQSELSADQKTLLTYHPDQNLFKVWSFPSLKLLDTVFSTENFRNEIYLSKSGKLFGGISVHGEVFIWKVGSRDPVKIPKATAAYYPTKMTFDDIEEKVFLHSQSGAGRRLITIVDLERNLSRDIALGSNFEIDEITDIALDPKTKILRLFASRKVSGDLILDVNLVSGRVVKVRKLIWTNTAGWFSTNVDKVLLVHSGGNGFSILDLDP